MHFLKYLSIWKIFALQYLKPELLGLQVKIITYPDSLNCTIIRRSLCLLHCEVYRGLHFSNTPVSTNFRPLFRFHRSQFIKKPYYIRNSCDILTCLTVPHLKSLNLTWKFFLTQHLPPHFSSGKFAWSLFATVTVFTSIHSFFHATN